MCKGTDQAWMPAQQKGLQFLTDKTASLPVLMHFELEAVTSMMTDAPGTAVLLQKQSTDA